MHTRTVSRAVQAPLRFTASRRCYARAVGGIFNQPPPLPPQPHKPGSSNKFDVSTAFGGIDVRKVGQSSPGKFQIEISVDDKAKVDPSTLGVPSGKTTLEPAKYGKDAAVNDHLSQSIRQDAAIQSSPSLDKLLRQLDEQAGVEIPHVLPNGNRGNPGATPAELQESIVTIAHIRPSRPGKKAQVVFSSGFPILDGGLFVTCAHPFHQAAALTKSYDAIEQQQARTDSRVVLITSSGKLIPIRKVASHLVMADLVVLEVDKALHNLRPLAVDPYPISAGSTVTHYNLTDVTLCDPTTLQPKGSWNPATVTMYQDRRGREAETGTYDQLNAILFDTEPTPGSSGAPILGPDNAVVGVVRGSEFSYAVRKLRGFGCPAETIFHAFKLM